MAEPTTWIVDTDAGVDDAVALLVSLQQENFNCRAITTVAGNACIEDVNRNVGCVLDLVHKDIPIYKGAARPFFQQIVRADDIMGADGLGGASVSLPPTQHLPSPGHAAAQLPILIKKAAQSGKVNLIALGPLTNLALALRLSPEMIQQVDRLFIMGGAVHGKGNSTPSAEFNFYCDPEAASVVFNAGFKELWLLPWEVSVQQPLSWDQYDRLCGFGTRQSEFFRLIMKAVEAFLRERGFHGVPLPDLLTTAVAIDPSLAVEVHDVYVEIQVSKGTGYGLSAVDWNHLTGKAPNTRVVTVVNAEAIYDHLEQRLKI